MSDEKYGRFVWYELMTNNAQNNLDFYKRVIGWGTQPFDQSPEPYTMWLNGETPIGGTMELPQQARDMGAPPHWISYVNVENLEATVAQVEKLGGGVHVPLIEVPTAGRIAILFDPSGATFAVIEPEPTGGNNDWIPRVGSVSWNELTTLDLDGAFTFYSTLFGWEEVDSVNMGPEVGKYLEFGHGKNMYGGMFVKPASMGDAPPNWLPYVRIADLDAAVAEVTAQGGQVVMPPMEVPGGDRVAVFVDHQGAALGLHQKA